MSQERGVPDPQEAHEYREVLSQGGLEEVRVHGVRSCEELFHKGKAILWGRVECGVVFRAGQVVSYTVREAMLWQDSSGE